MIRVRSLISRSMNWFMLGISFVNTIVAFVILAQGENTIEFWSRSIVHFLEKPAIIHLAVAISTLVVSLLTYWKKQWHWTAGMLALIALLTMVGLFSSLLYRDDYSGGSCGEFDWPAGHLHAGYPYSWLDGEICVPPQSSLSEFAHQNPEKAAWHLDLPALLVDLLFWASTGILLSSILSWGLDLGKQEKHIT